jgi:predicted Zn-dependent protease with MMP-like domain
VDGQAATGRGPSRRRDRRGRGPRGPLAPPDVPLVESPTERFDNLVLDAVEHVEERWLDQLRSLEFAVEEVPPPEPPAQIDDEIASAGVPLARLLPPSGTTPARVVIYRRPLELRAVDREDLEDLVHDIVVEEVAHFLGLSPEVVDPEGFGDDDD